MTTPGLKNWVQGTVKSDWVGVYPAFKTAVEAESSESDGAMSYASAAAAVAAVSMLL